jgi:hypothetical protein
MIRASSIDGNDKQSICGDGSVRSTTWNHFRGTFMWPENVQTCAIFSLLHAFLWGFEQFSLLEMTWKWSENYDYGGKCGFWRKEAGQRWPEGNLRGRRLSYWGVERVKGVVKAECSILSSNLACCS